MLPALYGSRKGRNSLGRNVRMTLHVLDTFQDANRCELPGISVAVGMKTLDECGDRRKFVVTLRAVKRKKMVGEGAGMDVK